MLIPGNAYRHRNQISSFIYIGAVGQNEGDYYVLYFSDTGRFLDCSEWVVIPASKEKNWKKVSAETEFR